MDQQRPVFGVREGLWVAGLSAFASFFFVVFTGGIVYGITFGATTDEQQAQYDAKRDALLLGDQLAVGENLYESTCAACHGQNGEGGVGPSIVGITERIPDALDHIQIVHEGRGRMPSFDTSLSDSQIESIVAYERQVLDR